MRVVRLALCANLSLAFLFLAGCSSNNGKIVGKWLCTDTDTMNREVKSRGFQIYMEFTSAHRFAMTAVGPNGQEELLSGDYALGAGDSVTLKNLSKPINGERTSLESITIVGDDLKWNQDKKPSIPFRRVDPTPAEITGLKG